MFRNRFELVRQRVMRHPLFAEHKLTTVKAILPDEIRKRENLPPLTAAQKKELNPAPPAPPPGQLGMNLDGEQGDVSAHANGNGNGAMPANLRS